MFMISTSQQGQPTCKGQVTKPGTERNEMERNEMELYGKVVKCEYSVDYKINSGKKAKV
jgi:hypothetical protein